MTRKAKNVKKRLQNTVFFKGAHLYSDKSCRRKTAEMGLEITIDNAMRSGSDFFSIRSHFWVVWGPFWDHLGSLGRLLGSLGRLLGSFLAPLGLSWTLLGSFWDVLGPLLGRSWPLLALPGPSGVDF